VQVAWAQNYIKEFITGYGQTLKDFDPQQKQEFGFIASCINGNFEKMLMAIRTAIVQFSYSPRPPEVTDEERHQTLKNALTKGSVFLQYYSQESDTVTGPTIERYRTFIETTDTIDRKLKDQYLSLLEEPSIIKDFKETIEEFSGGRRFIRKTKIRKTLKRMKSKQKKTLKKPKKTKKTKKPKKTKKTKKHQKKH
jgi:hypothetical protein